MDVYLTSPWIPSEWVRAHGFTPRGISSLPDGKLGNWPLSEGICAFAESAVRFSSAPSDTAVIFATSCDQLRRGFDFACENAGTHQFSFNLPSVWQSETARHLFRCEVERLGAFLTNLGGNRPDPHSFFQLLQESNIFRKRLLDSATTSAPRDFARAITQFHNEGTFSPIQEYSVRPSSRSEQPKGWTTYDGEMEEKIPLALIGGPFLASHWKWLDRIEAAGGVISLNATETGERSVLTPFHIESPSTVFEDFINGYFENIVDTFQRPNTRLYSWLAPRLKSRSIQGIILWHYTGCDLWRAEAQSLREAFKLPVLLLEATEQVGMAPRELTRLQAFLETLR